VRAAVQDDAALGADELREAGRLAALVAEAAVDRRADPLAAALRLEHPRLREERRPVPHVALVAAPELGDPLALVVVVEADDRPLHTDVVPAYTDRVMTRSVAWDRVTEADVARSIEEYDRLGPEQFFATHGFAPTTTYDLVWEERLYPPKAILGTAYELATGERLASADFEGGKSGAVKVLTELGFDVRER
jgi:hypothetical protein